MKFKTKAEVQSFVSGIRRELKDNKKPANELSYNEVLSLLSRALDFKNWNAMEATLESEAAAVPSAIPTVPAAPALSLAAKYPLVNKGQFDFVAKGEPGEMLTGHFTKIGGTMQVLLAATGFSLATRKANGSLDFDEDGGSDVFWDTQKAQLDKNGNYIWTDEDNHEMGTSPSIIVPEDCGEPEKGKKLPVREALLEAYREYFNEVPLVERNPSVGLSRLCEHAAKTIGYSLTKKELKAFATLMGVAL